MTWKRRFKWGERVLHQNHGIAFVDFETERYVEIKLLDGGKPVKVSPHSISSHPAEDDIEKAKEEIRRTKGEWVDSYDHGEDGL